MIITISGKPGSGKSTIAKMLAEKYKLKHYSTGQFFRSKAREKNLSLKEFSTLTEQSKEHDQEIDNWQIQLGKKEDNFIIDGRLSHKFIENAIKIYLDVDKEVGAIRIMNEKREDEKALDKKHALELWESRMNSEHGRYSNYYKIDLHDFLQYDLVLDTSDLTIEQAFNEVTRFIDGVKR